VSRRRDFEVDPDQWPAFDVGALPPVRQIPFKARRLAVELYASGTTLSQIESRTGVERRHFYRLLERCLAHTTPRRSSGSCSCCRIGAPSFVHGA
jgi:putative transposase